MKNLKGLFFILSILFLSTACKLIPPSPLEFHGSFSCEGPACWDIFDEDDWIDGFCGYNYIFSGWVKSNSTHIDKAYLVINTYENNRLFFQEKILIELELDNKTAFFKKYSHPMNDMGDVAECDDFRYSVQFRTIPSFSLEGPIIPYTGDFTTTSK